MSSIHTDLPKRRGELRFAKCVQSISDSMLHAWFNLDFIPSVEDIDALIIHEKIGAFVIEVKGVDSLDAVLGMSFQSCHIKGRPVGPSPHYQAYNGQSSMRQHYPETGFIFYVATSCWPFISRSEWNDYWDQPRITGDFSLRNLFKEDLLDEELLIQRLRYIYSNPPLRKGGGTYRHSPKHFANTAALLTRKMAGKREPQIQSDLKFLRSLENKINAQVQQEAGNVKNGLIYEGFPGTGKTFRLLQLGRLEFARKSNNPNEERKRILYICFNKVLAADIKRRFLQWPLIQQDPERFQVTDIFQLAARDFAYLNSNLDAAEHDEWGELLVADLRKEKFLEKFDTILVDEAQDLKQWHFALISLHAKVESRIFVAIGKGQELYGPSSVLPTEWQNLPNKGLNRNFRNPEPIFKFAVVFFEAYPNAEKIEKIITKRFSKEKRVDAEDLPFAYDRSGGPLPQIKQIPDSQLNFNIQTNPMLPEEQAELYCATYETIFKDKLTSLEKHADAIDLLIIVPDNNSIEYKYALKALENLKISYTDYLVDDNKRQIAQKDSVRIVSFHSCRGLEGYTIVILGFDKIKRVSEYAKTSVLNLGFILLSRAVLELVIVHSELTILEEVKFLHKILGSAAYVTSTSNGA